MLLKPHTSLRHAARTCTAIPTTRSFLPRRSVVMAAEVYAGEAQHFKHICIGGGNAAGYLAKEFAACGSAGQLAIVSDEGVCAYERPALSKAYLAGESPARLPGFHTCVGGGGERQAPEWYKEKGITYMLNTPVLGVDVARKSIRTTTGLISYENLVVATGARTVKLSNFGVPGADLGGLHYLRNVADADGLVAAIQATKAAGGKAIIIGGGYIGMEVASQMAGNGIPTTIVCPEPHLLARLFTPKIAGVYEKFYEGKGITIARDSSVVGLEGEGGKVQRVVVKAKAGGAEAKLEASLVVVGVGARPNVELLEGQVDMALGGIKVDGHMQTSVKGVYAVGDVAAFPLKMAGGKLVRQEHVVHARQSAAHAVQAIHGKAAAPYDYLPYFYSRVFGFSWQFWGTSEGAETVHFGDFSGAAGAKFGAYFVRDGKVVGVFAESASGEEQEAAKKVAREQPAAGDVKDLEAKGLAFAMSRM